MHGIRNFIQFYSGGGGGGGVQVRRPENTLDNVFLVLFFYSPELILQLTEGSNGFITEKTILFKGSRGGPEFSRGRGSNFFLMLISKETHITCDFPGDPNPPPPPPPPPLDPHMPEDARFHRIFIRRISW